MTFNEFIERSLTDFEERIRYEGVAAATIEARLTGARQFARQLLGEVADKAPLAGKRSQAAPSTKAVNADPSTRRFGGPQ
jgi:hypothetical protein